MSVDFDHKNPNGHLPTFVNYEHAEKMLMLAHIQELKPGSKAVLYIIDPVQEAGPDNELGEDIHVLDTFGVGSEWYAILGLLQAGIQYAGSLMWTTPTGEEEEGDGEDETSTVVETEE